MSLKMEFSAFSRQTGTHLNTEEHTDELYYTVTFQDTLPGVFTPDKNEDIIGDLYFTNVRNIFRFINYGCFVVEVTLPLDDPSFNMTRGQFSDRWKCNKLILGNKYRLSDVNTIKMLVKKRANYRIADDILLRWSARSGYLDIVRYLIDDLKVNVNAQDNAALCWSSFFGHLDIVIYLIEKGAHVGALNNCALRWAASNGHFYVVTYLVAKGADVRDMNYQAIKLSIKYGHIDIANYLLETELINRSQANITYQGSFIDFLLEIIST